ncbi:MAG: sugar phosphate isomerase/epimerase [Deltaproteobacteria bacterium]|nr:sugar phosphate isomerase/epimerase [Deltaproteobacteria bacterium]
MDIEQIKDIYPMGLTSVALPHDDFSLLPLFTKNNIGLMEVTPLVPDNKEWTAGDPDSTKKFLALCETNNLTPESVHCFFLDSLGHDVADKDPVVRKTAIALNKVLFQGAKDIGAKYMVAHLYGWNVEGRSEDETMSLARDVILGYLPEAERTGIKIAIENLFEDWAVTHINQLIDEIDHPLLGICFDTGHAAVYGDVEKELRLCGNRLIGLHIHDNHFLKDEHFVPFRGKIDWKAFTSALADIGYKGPLMLESYVRNDGEDFDSHFGECAQAYKKLTEFILEDFDA